jgi:hypothetical protein
LKNNPDYELVLAGSYPGVKATSALKKNITINDKTPAK